MALSLLRLVNLRLAALRSEVLLNMAIYLSMQRVRFSSSDGYEKFKTVFADTRNHLTKLPGLHASHLVGPRG
jgi:hypothetical protein